MKIVVHTYAESPEFEIDFLPSKGHKVIIGHTTYKVIRIIHDLNIKKTYVLLFKKEKVVE